MEPRQPGFHIWVNNRFWIFDIGQGVNDVVDQDGRVAVHSSHGVMEAEVWYLSHFNTDMNLHEYCFVDVS